MNKHIIRIMLAGASFALSSVVNVASGQVLGGGGGITGSLGGSLNNATGTLNGAGSFGGALDAAPIAGRSQGMLDRTGGLASDSGRKMRDRARSTTSAVKNEAQGASGDVTSSAVSASNLVKEEPAALTSAATSSATAAADAAGSLDVDATTEDLTKVEGLDVPSTHTTGSESSTGSSNASPVPTLSGTETSASETTAPTTAPRTNPSVSARAGARGTGEAQAQM